MVGSPSRILGISLTAAAYPGVYDVIDSRGRLSFVPEQPLFGNLFMVRTSGQSVGGGGRFSEMLSAPRLVIHSSRGESRSNGRSLDQLAVGVRRTCDTNEWFFQAAVSIVSAGSFVAVGVTTGGLTESYRARWQRQGQRDEHRHTADNVVD